MGTIQSSIGLVTGMDIGATVDALIQLAAKPRDMLNERTETLKTEQLAVTELSALLLACRYSSDALGRAALFDERAAASSNESVLLATATGTPNVGTYQFTPVRMAQNQQWLSSGFASDTKPIGQGTISLRFGSNVQRSTPANVLNGGAGVQRGKIRITDRSGASAQIDLTAAQTLDDVIEAINNNTSINVTATAHGDGLRLTDNTGQSTANLRVQEVSGGTTAASLGLAGVNAAASVVDGEDIVWLHDDLALDALNDGNGVRIGDYNFANTMANLRYTLRDGTTADVNFYPADAAGTENGGQLTLGDVIEAFNQIAPDKLRAEIAPDGDRLVIRDLTEGSGEFSLSTIENRYSELVEDLGIGGPSADGVIVGRRLLGGAKSVLLSSLNGGAGFGELGAVELTDRSGRSDTVSLAGAETLEDVIDAINAADVGIRAQLNQAKTGIELVDTTGKSASNLIVADADELGTATKLGLAADVGKSSSTTGDMHLQIVSHNTKLSDLNGGAGVSRSFFTIIDANGRQDTIDLRDSSIVTVGDLMDAIRRDTDLTISAEINATGDGIQIRDYVNVDSPLKIVEGNGSTAADLHLLDAAKRIKYEGEDVYVIDGSATTTITIGPEDTLDSLRQKINSMELGVIANTFNDGSSKPFRLSLQSLVSGKNGALVIDTSNAGFTLEETVEAKDALMVFGDPASAGRGVLVTSRTNTFSGVVTGLRLEIKSASTTPVTVTVQRSDANVVANATKLVESYNKFRDRYDALTEYNVETDEAAVLFGDASALRLDQALSGLLTGRFLGLGSFQSLAQIGINIQQDGTLSLDTETLQEAFAKDPDALRDFFVGASDGPLPADLGITISGEWIRVDQEKLNEKYAEDPEAVIEYFGRVRGQYSLEELGVAFTEDGVEVNENRLQALFTADAQMAAALKAEKTDGVSARFADVVDSLSGIGNSLLTGRFNTLASKIERNEEKIAFHDKQLENQRYRLTLEFYRMELAIAKLQTNMDALASIKYISADGSTDDDS
ncbi:MAG: flagellar filament capping protein FliD [Pirellulales bacterium]|nr:flagellar filament capping protein FliD [Pirellulales bacterium]